VRTFYIERENFLPSQLKWWNLPNFYKLLVGGYGSGKTHIGAMRSIFLSRVNSGIPGQYVSPSYPMAEKTIVISLKEILTRSGLDYTYNETKHRFFIHNWDGIIWIGSGEKPESLKGSNLAWFGIDEPFVQKKDVFKQMIARTRHPEAKHHEGFMTGTAESLNWGFELINADEIDIGYVVASTLDNPYLPQEYKDNLLASYTEEEIQAYIYGKFVNLTAGRVCKPFDREKHVIRRDDLEELKKVGHLFVGCDFNVDYMSANIGVDLNGHIHYFDSFRKSNSNTFEMADWLRAKYPNLRHCYPDATGKARKTSSTKSDHAILKDANFTIHSKPGNPPVKDRVNAFNRLLKDDRITIDPKCKELIADCELMVWKRGGLDQSTDPARTHAFDSASYFTHFKYNLIRRTATSVQWN
jgi:hypothetical protein